MPNSHPIIEFTIIIESDSQNFSDWELNELALGLREELFEYGANAKLAKRKGGVPQNAKAGDPITIGAIILALAAPTIPNILSIIQNWLLRQKDQTIRVRIGEVDIEVPRDVSQAEIAKIVNIIETIPQDVDKRSLSSK